MGFSEKVAAEALLLCERCCCICHKFCGKKIELHHIKHKANGGDDSLENCIPLCFDCHADMGKNDAMHPKGKQYSELELIGHRDRWHAKIKNSIYSTNGNSTNESDKKLFQDICRVFSSDIRYWLSEADLGGYHPYTVFEPFVRLLDISKDPLNEFVHVEMEKLRGNLLNTIRKFISYKAINTFVRNISGEEMCVTRQWMTNHTDWVPQDMSCKKSSTQYESEAQELNRLATEVWDSYCIFVRDGRRLLNL